MSTDKGQKAKDLFLNGYNCAQAVYCAFCEDFGMDKAVALNAAACFGGGLGRQREVCGAVSGMCMALALKYAPSNPADQEAKAEFYARIQEVCRRFKQENGSIICRELLGLDKEPCVPTPEPRTKAYYERRPCPDKVKSAAAILEQYFKEQNN